MARLRGVDSLEIHEGTHRLFTVYTHGDTHLCLHVDHIEYEGAAWALFGDPKSSHGERYSEVHFESPRTIEIVDDTLTTEGLG